MNNISPLASVSPDAKLGDNIEIGPFAYVEGDVEIGDGCKIFPHANVFQYVKMGKNCQIYPGAVVGAVPQDLKFEGEVTYVELGDNVTVRECATINRGTKASGKYVTKVSHMTVSSANIASWSAMPVSPERQRSTTGRSLVAAQKPISSLGSAAMPWLEECPESTRMSLLTPCVPTAL